MVTIQIVPYSEIEGLPSSKKIKKLLNIAKEDKIVVLQGRLKKEEEGELIQSTMEEVSEKFKGIEIAVIDPYHENSEGVSKIKNTLMGFLLGNRSGLTIIGPAGVVKEIKKDPNKIELLTGNVTKRKRKS